MVKDYAKFEIGKLTVEVNWTKEKDVRNCQKVRITVDGHSEEISKTDFDSMFFLFGDKDMQEQFVGMRDVEIVPITKMLGIKAKKDIKEGEIIAVQHSYHVPKEMREKLIALYPDKYKIPELSPTKTQDEPEKEVV